MEKFMRAFETAKKVKGYHDERLSLETQQMYNDEREMKLARTRWEKSHLPIAPGRKHLPKKVLEEQWEAAKARYEEQRQIVNAQKRVCAAKDTEMKEAEKNITYAKRVAKDAVANIGQGGVTTPAAADYVDDFYVDVDENLNPIITPPPLIEVSPTAADSTTSAGEETQFIEKDSEEVEKLKKTLAEGEATAEADKQQTEALQRNLQQAKDNTTIAHDQLQLIENYEKGLLQKKTGDANAMED